MKKLAMILAVMGLTCIFFSGCETVSMDTGNTPEINIADLKLSDSQIKEDIIAGIKEDKWNPVEKSGNTVGAQILVRGHYFVSVNVNYTNQKVTIVYDDSKNMLYDSENQTINRKYYSWVERLRASIEKQLMSHLLK